MLFDKNITKTKKYGQTQLRANGVANLHGRLQIIRYKGPCRAGVKPDIGAARPKISENKKRSTYEHSFDVLFRFTHVCLPPPHKADDSYKYLPARVPTESYDTLPTLFDLN